MSKDSAARIELDRSFHQVGTVNEKVSDSDFVPSGLKHGRSKARNLGKVLQNQRWFCRQTLMP